MLDALFGAAGRIYDANMCSQTPAERDLLLEAAVLRLLLIEHPRLLTEAEVVRELESGAKASGDSDAIEVAVRSLVGAGLVHRHGRFVLPSRAALCFDQLAVG